MSRPAAGDTSTPNSTPTPTPTNAGSSSDGGPGSSSVSGSAASAHRDRAAARPTLPDRNVTAVTIEDAYVRFIFYCNPALPLDLDTEQLRDAFRNPPRSGGKTFSTFVIFELVRSFYNKEIRTWTELTTRLGVEPPDPSKDESAQKIAQYGVRLKVRCVTHICASSQLTLLCVKEMDELDACQSILRVPHEHAQ